MKATVRRGASTAGRAAPWLLAAAALAGCGLLPDEPGFGSIEVAAGNAQTGLVGVSLPDSLVVLVTNEDGELLEGQSVQWEVVSGGGSIRFRSTSDDEGQAMALWTLGQDAGPQTVRASVGGQEVDFTATAELPQPGKLYNGRNGYVEYSVGELPIVISAPHGGTLEPTEIPDRTYGTFARDTNVRETAYAIADAFEARFGARPHIIALRLHRTKLDANRDAEEAAQGSVIALQTWREWHGFIEQAEAAVDAAYDVGLYFDLHGHGHPVQRLELGYLITGSELALPEDQLEVRAVTSSLRVLAQHTPLGFIELLRGPFSLGTLFEQEGIPAVPSASQPDPGDEPYFSAGYNTANHSVWGDGVTAGFQLEAHYGGIRDTPANREAFAEAVVNVVDAFFDAHYGYDLDQAGEM